MSKVYSLVLNSNIPQNLDSTGGIGACKYYVNWGAFLPTDYHKFKVSFTFRSDTILDDPLVAIQIGFSMGSTYCYSQSTSSSTFLGTILPKSYASDVTTAPNYYYETHERDNCKVMVNYPTNSYVTVSITDFAGVQISPSLFQDYIMQINFEVIE